MFYRSGVRLANVSRAGELARSSAFTLLMCDETPDDVGYTT